MTATASAGYVFDSWSRDGEVVSNLSTYSFVVTESVDFVAVFNSGTLVGEAGGSNVYLPSYSYYKYTLSQQIYTPEELGGVGVISNISYFNTGGTKTRSYDIYMVHTDKAVFESEMDWIAVTEADLVFSGEVTMSKGYWNAIVLDTPFAYDGTSNLAIVVDDNSGNYTGAPHMSCRVFNTEGIQAIRVYSDSPDYDPYNPSEYSGTLHSVKNQILLNRQQCIVNAVASDLSMGSVDGSGLYEPGGVCTMTAVANTGYCFYYWTEDGTVVSTDATYSFTVTRDRDLVAHFGSLLNVMAVSDPAEGGVVTGSGEYEYGATCTLTATANEGYVFRYWTENDIIVSIDVSYSYVVESNRFIVAHFDELTNHWTTQGDYQNSMFMIGIVQIDGVEQVLPYLELAAFCNGECRGSALPEKDGNRWLYYMTLEGNNGDEITFRLYDHTLQQELDLYCYNVVSFAANDILGLDSPYEVQFVGSFTVSTNVSPEDAGTVTGAGEYPIGSSATLTATANEGYAFVNWTVDGEIVSTELSYTFTVTAPVTITANFNYIRIIQLKAGWNWFSTYLDITLNDLKAALVDALPGTSILITSQSGGSTTYNGSMWRGTLNMLDLTQMYMIKVNTSCEITLMGMPINPAEHPITIHNGNNWIAFPLNGSMTLTDAFAGFAISGDIIISQIGSSAYLGNRWRGAIDNLVPGCGYLYKSNVQGNRVFTFPTITK